MPPEKWKWFPCQSTCFLMDAPETGVLPVPEVQLADIPRTLSDYADEGDLISVERRTANAVSVNVGPLPDWRLLLIVDADYPGWGAYMDDVRVGMFRANDAFKAVLVPPGEHRVDLRFRPVLVYLGVALSLAGACWGAMWTYRTNRTDRTYQTEDS
jgi:hypothetical protein